jgi:hypothetical protein
MLEERLKISTLEERLKVTIRLLLMGEARDIRIEITHNPLLFGVAQVIF